MSDRIENLRLRSDLLRKLREFFYDRGFIEVETPLLADEIIPELHIEPPQLGNQWLQASPELHMKRLLSEGMSAIFQVTRSFRAGEVGQLHNPEFTIVEWYRVGGDMHAGMTLLDQLCQALLNTPPAQRTSYAEAFHKYLGLCPHTATCDELSACAKQNGISAEGIRTDDRDEWLNLLLAVKIEPELGKSAPELLYYYPVSQASLANTVVRDNGVEVAERFELYWQGIELANGFHELTDAVALRGRLTRVNEERIADGRPALPLPESLLAVMERGLPVSTGCALGFDRLAMLAVGANTIREVMTFGPDVV